MSEILRWLISNQQQKRFPLQKSGTLPSPCPMQFLAKTLNMTSDGFGEMFEGDFTEKGGKRCHLCADMGARTPIGGSGNWSERSACDQQSNIGRPLFFCD